MSKEYKFNRNYLKLLIDNKDKLIEVPINDAKLILTYCEILLDRQDKTIEFIKEYHKHRDSFKWNEQDYIDVIDEIEKRLGGNINETNNN